jgi:hypothetical protein
MGLRCKRCGSEEHTKNGFMRGKQRYRCKVCGLIVTDTPPRGMPFPAQGHGRPALRERPVDEPDGQAPGRVHAVGDDLDRAVRQGARPKA